MVYWCSCDNHNLFIDADAKNVMYAGSALPGAVAIKPQTIDNPKHLQKNAHKQVIYKHVIVHVDDFLLLVNNAAKTFRRL